jgi:hypothetical protein
MIILSNLTIKGDEEAATSKTTDLKLTELQHQADEFLASKSILRGTNLHTYMHVGRVVAAE